MLINGPGTAL